MLTELYIDALLVDEELADQVSEAWDKGEIDGATAFLMWWLMASHRWPDASVTALASATTAPDTGASGLNRYMALQYCVDYDESTGSHKLV